MEQQPPVVDQAIMNALEEQQRRYNQLIQDLKSEIDDVKKATTPPLMYTSPPPGVTQRDTRVMESMSLVGELQALKKDYLDKGGDDQTFIKQIEDTIQEAIEFQATQNTESINLQTNTLPLQDNTGLPGETNDPFSQKVLYITCISLFVLYNWEKSSAILTKNY